MFRLLKAEEIEIRVGSIKENGLSLLLFKDARCDMNVLDETVGAFNWKRSHLRDNANCTVSLWDESKSQWISKEDTGTESNTEKEKGLASDSFKRACFNWGIGRELYTAGFIWVNAKDCSIKPKDKGPGFMTYDNFSLKSISYDENRRINGLEIINNKTKKVVFDLIAPNKVIDEPKEVIAPTAQETLEYAKKIGVTEEQLITKYNGNMGAKEQITKFDEIGDTHRLALYKLLQKQEKAKK